MNKLIIGGVLVTVMGGAPTATYFLTKEEKSQTTSSETKKEKADVQGPEEAKKKAETPTTVEKQ